jgi:hypothetical protein
VRPGPLSDGVGKTGPHGVLHDVTARGEQVALPVDRSRGEAVGEQVAEATVALVERLRVAALEALDAARQLGLGAVEDQVVVRRHQAERMHRPAEALGAGADVCEEEPPVVVVAEDRAPVHAARHHVEVPVRKRGSRHPRHAAHETVLGACNQPLGTTWRTLLTPATSVADVSRVRPWFYVLER